MNCENGSLNSLVFIITVIVLIVTIINPQKAVAILKGISDLVFAAIKTLISIIGSFIDALKSASYYFVVIRAMLFPDTNHRSNERTIKLAIVFLSIVSYITTFSSMSRLIDSLTIALLATFGVQAVIIALGLELGSELRLRKGKQVEDSKIEEQLGDDSQEKRKESKETRSVCKKGMRYGTCLTWIILILCMFVSIFFSYAFIQKEATLSLFQLIRIKTKYVRIYNETYVGNKQDLEYVQEQQEEILSKTLEHISVLEGEISDIIYEWSSVNGDDEKLKGGWEYVQSKLDDLKIKNADDDEQIEFAGMELDDFESMRITASDFEAERVKLEGLETHYEGLDCIEAIAIIVNAYATNTEFEINDEFNKNELGLIEDAIADYKNTKIWLEASSDNSNKLILVEGDDFNVNGEITAEPNTVYSDLSRALDSTDSIKDIESKAFSVTLQIDKKKFIAYIITKFAKIESVLKDMPIIEYDFESINGSTLFSQDEGASGYDYPKTRDDLLEDINLVMNQINTVTIGFHFGSLVSALLLDILIVFLCIHSQLFYINGSSKERMKEKQRAFFRAMITKKHEQEANANMMEMVSILGLCIITVLILGTMGENATFKRITLLYPVVIFMLYGLLNSALVKRQWGKESSENNSKTKKVGVDARKTKTFNDREEVFRKEFIKIITHVKVLDGKYPNNKDAVSKYTLNTRNSKTEVAIINIMETLDLAEIVGKTAYFKKQVYVLLSEFMMGLHMDMEYAKMELEYLELGSENRKNGEDKNKSDETEKNKSDETEKNTPDETAEKKEND